MLQFFSTNNMILCSTLNFFKKCFLFLFLKISRKFWTQKYSLNAVAKCALLDKKEWPYISFFCTQKLSWCCILMYLSMHQIFQQVITCAYKYSNNESDFLWSNWYIHSKKLAINKDWWNSNKFTWMFIKSINMKIV